MNNFEQRVLRIEPINTVLRYKSMLVFHRTFPLYRPSRSLEQFRTQGFLRIESTAVQRCARNQFSFGYAVEFLPSASSLPKWQELFSKKGKKHLKPDRKTALKEEDFFTHDNGLVV